MVTGKRWTRWAVSAALLVHFTQVMQTIQWHTAVLLRTKPACRNIPQPVTIAGPKPTPSQPMCAQRLGFRRSIPVGFGYPLLFEGPLAEKKYETDP